MVGYLNHMRKSILIDIASVVWDTRRHNPFVYCNQNSISADYFAKAEQSLDDGFIYLVFADTGSSACELIRLFTQTTHAHVSISFDPHLDTIVSYNGGFKTKRPGMHTEQIEYYYQKQDASIVVYKLPASYQQKRKLLREIKRINREGSSYNLVGWQAEGNRENIMFCSQFVYTVFKKAGLSYFTKDPARVRPIDFVELDEKKQLVYCFGFYVQDLIDNSCLLEEANYVQENSRMHRANVASPITDLREAR